MFGGCQFTGKAKDSRHTRSVLELKLAKTLFRMLRRCQSSFNQDMFFAFFVCAFGVCHFEIWVEPIQGALLDIYIFLLLAFFFLFLNFFCFCGLSFFCLL